jgi:transposase
VKRPRKGRETANKMAASRFALEEGRKHLTRERRAEASLAAFNLSKKTDSLGEAAATVAKMFGISFTTAQSWIRRGRHLANKPKTSKAATKR